MVPRDVMLRGLSMIHSPAMLTVPEADFLYDTAAGFKEPIAWAELGVWCGRGFWAAGCGLPERSLLDGYDTFEGLLPIKEGSNVISSYAPTGTMQELLAQAVADSIMDVRIEPLDWVFLHPCESHKAAVESSPVDVLVVDAAHDYESVKRDIVAWLPRMKPGGLIIGHDYTPKNPGVVKAFDERFGDKCQPIPETRFVRVQL